MLKDDQRAKQSLQEWANRTKSILHKRNRREEMLRAGYKGPCQTGSVVGSAGCQVSGPLRGTPRGVNVGFKKGNTSFPNKQHAILRRSPGGKEGSSLILFPALPMGQAWGGNHSQTQAEHCPPAGLRDGKNFQESILRKSYDQHL